QIRRRGLPRVPRADPHLRGDHGLQTESLAARYRGAQPVRRPAQGAGGRAGGAVSELLALGASHKTAPLAVRERLALLQGQVERAYESALAAHTTGPTTNRLFRAALATGKRVRTETSISSGHASVATVAVEAARTVVGEPHHVVIVGAGDTSEQVARAF